MAAQQFIEGNPKNHNQVLIGDVVTDVGASPLDAAPAGDRCVEDWYIDVPHNHNHSVLDR